MIAADTSAWVDFLNGAETLHAQKLESALKSGRVVLPTHVLFELLSSPGLTPEVSHQLLILPRLELQQGFWERAGGMRRLILKKGLKARFLDVLIAQNCIDSEIPLIVADQDYQHFTRFGLMRA